MDWNHFWIDGGRVCFLIQTFVEPGELSRTDSDVTGSGRSLRSSNRLCHDGVKGASTSSQSAALTVSGRCASKRLFQLLLYIFHLSHKNGKPAKDSDQKKDFKDSEKEAAQRFEFKRVQVITLKSEPDYYEISVFASGR